MEDERTENSTETPTAQENVAPAEAEKVSSELLEPRWSVVTFDGCAASGLIYDEAIAEMKKLESRKISGLCIVTDEAAVKMSK